MTDTALSWLSGNCTSTQLSVSNTLATSLVTETDQHKGLMGIFFFFNFKEWAGSLSHPAQYRHHVLPAGQEHWHRCFGICLHAVLCGITLCYTDSVWHPCSEQGCSPALGTYSSCRVEKPLLTLAVADPLCLHLNFPSLICFIFQESYPKRPSIYLFLNKHTSVLMFHHLLWLPHSRKPHCANRGFFSGTIFIPYANSSLCMAPASCLTRKELKS